MEELFKFNAQRDKLQGVCDENKLTFSFRHDKYPISLTIRPLTGVAAQMTMLEEVEEKGYISPDASIVFSYEDGALTYKMSDDFAISDATFSKIKNIFKNMLFLWLQVFFRDVIQKLEAGTLTMQNLPTLPAAPPKGVQIENAEPLEVYDDLDEPDPLAVDDDQESVEDPVDDDMIADHLEAQSEEDFEDEYPYEEPQGNVLPLKKGGRK